MSGDVRGFFHVCCRGPYREVVWEIVHALLESRLYERSASIELGVLGDHDQQRAVERLLKPFERFHIAYRSSDIKQYEFPTLDLLQKACQTWAGPVYYLHTKGVTRSPFDQYARYWRLLMLDEVVTNHERCISELESADTVGTNWRWNHYSGNFWWARASHINLLPEIRGLQRCPRPITSDPVWNQRLQCEFWIGMVRGRFICAGYSGLDLYQQLRWTTSASQIINDLLAAGGGRRFVELSMDGRSPYFDAVVAESKLAVSYLPRRDPLAEQDFLSAEPPGGGYDLILVDTWHESEHCLAVMERCLPKLSDRGVLVVHDSNPPSEWHQRPADEFVAGTEWNGQVWQAVVSFRMRHPTWEVFTVDTDWGCTVIRPSRPARRKLGASLDKLDWATLEPNRTRLLNVVDVGHFRRSLYAEPYLAGRAQLTSRTELINFLISVRGLDSYLEIGLGDGGNLAQVIAPIRQSVDPNAEATYWMSSDDFFAQDHGLERYDLIFIDGLHEEDQCLRDLGNSLQRLSEEGFIVAHDANPPTEWHQRPLTDFEPGSEWNGAVWRALVRFRHAHPEVELRTFDIDWGCAVLWRCTERSSSAWQGRLPNLDWNYFDAHRHELLSLVLASATELHKLLGCPP
jgi:Methyltransferase domain